jgi:hypothetical protein
MKPLRLKSLAILAIVVSPLLGTAHAGTESKSFKDKVVVEPPTCNFRDFEIQLDGFFTGVVGNRSHGNTLNSGVGGGTALNIFFARYFGLGVEADWYGNGGSAEHMIMGNAFFRYPICSLNLAPYVMVGGGAGWDHRAVGYGSVGGGLEYRFLKNVGLFGDARWIYGAPDNLALFRTGVRFAF